VKRPLRLVAAAAALLLATAPTLAWAPAARVRMADEATRLMPGSLRLALQHHREALLRGALEPMAGEDGPEHRPASAGGTLEASIADRHAAVVRALQEGRSFGEVVRALGELAHFLADAEFPPNAEAEADARYVFLAEFVESRRARFPLVFYGHEDAALEGRDLPGFTRRELLEAARLDAELKGALQAAGPSPRPASFDDRSVPFAVGSLAWSRSVTGLVRAWLDAWRRGGGDLARTPYLPTEERRRREQDR
jgi:hypothetical protein